MSATGAEAGGNLVPAGPVRPATADTALAAGTVEDERATGELVADRAERSPRQLVRAGAAGILAVLAGGAAWLLLRHGVRTDSFPPFLTGTQSTPITRYSGPWITAAAAAGLLAALLLLWALVDVVRWCRAVPKSAA